MGLKRRVGRAALTAAGTLVGDRGEIALLHERLGYVPNPLVPRSFNEKILKRRLGPVSPLWTTLADKVAAGNHVAGTGRSDLVPRTYLVTDAAEAIRFAALPKRFVVKASHASGLVRFVEDSRDVDEAGLRAQCAAWLRQEFGASTLERWYIPIRPHIVVEEYLVDDDFGVPVDFKFWVFHGRVEFVQVDRDRLTRHTRAIYSREWERQLWNITCPDAPDTPRPRRLGEMIDIAERLAAIEPSFIRIDLYCVNDERICFGEFTLAPGAGRSRFRPGPEADFHVGSLW